jgi:hypothetical protein
LCDSESVWSKVKELWPPVTTAPEPKVSVARLSLYS